MTQATQPLLSVRDVRTHFHTPRGRVHAVDGVSFDLAQGQTLGIVGESGCGKSVLARSLLRLVPEPPGVRAGQIIFEGRDLQQLDEASLRKVRGGAIAMIFQDPMSALNPVMTIGQQIAEVLALHLDLRGAPARTRMVELLAQVGLSSPERRLSEYPHQLSGGMRQRVTIAMALACRPKLLIADEPTTALDVTIQMQILILLKRIQRETGMALIFISHDLGAVGAVADRIAVMYAGRIVEEAPGDALFARHRMPYTQALLRARPDPGLPPHARLAALDGRPPDLANLPPGCAFAPRCERAEAACRQARPELESTAGHGFACWRPLPLERASAPIGAVSGGALRPALGQPGGLTP